MPKQPPVRERAPIFPAASGSRIAAAFTLATYVHLLDGDLGKPLAILQNGGQNAESAG